MAMDPALWWLVLCFGLLCVSFVSYLLLSTCLGPPLLRALKNWLDSHARATRSRSTDARGAYVRANAYHDGFSSGRGGPEGFEMSALGKEEAY